MEKRAEDYKSFYNDLRKHLVRNKAISKAEISKIKVALCRKHGLRKIPTDIETMFNIEEKRPDKNKNIAKQLQTKPSRTGSGVAVVAIMTAPHKCPHAAGKRNSKFPPASPAYRSNGAVLSRSPAPANLTNSVNLSRPPTHSSARNLDADSADVGPCIYCPGGIDSAFGNVPQSYTGKEPATMRGIRNNYDPYLQIFNRLEQYVCLGHDFQKIELIIMGGTFPSFPDKYKNEFIMFSFKALNDFGEYFFKKGKNGKKGNNGKFDLPKFKEFFEMPGDIRDSDRVRRIQKRVLELKNKNLGLDYADSPPTRPLRHQKMHDLHDLHVLSDLLEKEQKRNETALVRCIGLTIETRPDYGLLDNANEMLSFGCTRVELGVQSIHGSILKRIKRGHSVKDSVKSIRILKDLGFKLNFHMMPGLPGSNLEKDEKMFLELFENPDFRPDMLKIYPCMVVSGTRLYDDWKKGKFKPMTTQEAAELIAKIKENVPEYCRIMRVQRDIPSNVIAAGVDRTNLRQYIDEILKKKDKKCRCIRCREPRLKDIRDLKIKIKTLSYEASNGFEFFISAEDEKKDILLGFCRLRFPSQFLRREITKDSALIRELHVYGAQQIIGSEKGKGAVQHHGLGRKLLKKAEEIARKNGRKKMFVISGVGVREYYRKLGYRKESVYMVKKI